MNLSTRFFCLSAPLRLFWLPISVLMMASPAQAQSYPYAAEAAYPASRSEVLRSNDQGESVSELQRRLTNLGYYNGPVNGYFDSATQAAVSRFQQANGLAADGVVGAATNGALYQDKAALGVNGSTGQSSGYLQMNDNGNRVTQLQQQLAQLGYYNGSATGVFDQPTQAAVMSFQRERGLAVDGIVGSATEAALYQSPQQSTQQTASTETPTYTPAATATNGLLQLGDVGSEVSDLQSRLQALGYYSGPISGSFGSQTQSALIAFQQAQGLTADGIAGPRVNAALESTTVSQSASSSQPAAVAATQPAASTATPTVTSTATSTTVAPTTVTPAVSPTVVSPTMATPMVTQPTTQPTAVQTIPTGQSTTSVQVPSPPSAIPQSQPVAQSQPFPSQLPSQLPSQPYGNEGGGRFGVTELQRRLQFRGFNPGEMSGVYDASTQNAITQAQQAYGLSQSDLFGN